MITVERKLIGYVATAIWPHCSAWRLTRARAVRAATAKRVQLQGDSRPYVPRHSDPSLYDPKEEW
ncbi:hypothetical protein [Streptomyces sp. AC495_CC817]|uniref:hypothetical protein n=1 Tax=Streptomyces sp. AC495_CC817 TaxID=2823900 RepID=UPI001C2671AA|nr:hypothetical protein [Streptomyces sp. AC495_CC817]